MELTEQDFASVRACGTGKNKILSQHFIQSFKPGEITPERALEVGEELCEKFLKGQYQYYLAVHVDKAHVHLHVIFNNCNMYDYKTFLELYPSGNIPKVENLEKYITSMQEKMRQKDAEYRQADKKSRELSEATRTIEEYLRHEQSRDQQQKRKRNGLE